MGQRVQALVYGVFLKTAHRDLLHDLDGEWKQPFPPEAGRVEDDIDNGKPCLGIAIAVQGCAEDDELDFPSGRLVDLAKIKPSPQVMKRWKFLSAWAKGLGCDLGKPELLSVEIERA